MNQEHNEQRLTAIEALLKEIRDAVVKPPTLQRGADGRLYTFASGRPVLVTDDSQD